MADWRTFTVGLRADTAGFTQQMGQASQSVKGFGQQSDKTTKATAKGWSKFSSVLQGVGVGLGLSLAQMGQKVLQFGVDAVHMGEQIEQSRAVLEGLTGSAQVAQDTMDGLRRVASGSSLDYSGFLGAAEALAYAGVQGEETVEILDHVQRAIVAAGGSSESLDTVGRVLLKMVNLGKVGRRELIQLSNTGVPILSALADHFGTTIEGVNALVHDGAVGIEDVLQVMSEGAGETWANMEAAAAGVEATWSATWKRWKGNAQVAVGALVADLLPRFTALMQRAGGMAADVFSRLSGVWSDLRDTGERLVDVAPDLWDGFSPIAGALLAAFGGAAYGALTVFASALSTISGFLADHPGLIQAVGVALAVWMGASVVSSIATAFSGMFETIALKAMYAADSIGEAGFGGALKSIGKAGAAAAVIYAITQGLQETAKASQLAREETERILDVTNARGSLGGLADAIELNKQRQHDAMATAITDHDNLGVQLGKSAKYAGQFLLGWAGVTNTVDRSTKQFNEATDQIEQLGPHYRTLDKHVDRLAHTYGLNRDQVMSLLDANEDLNYETATTDDLTEALGTSLTALAGTMGVSEEQAASMAAAMGLNAEETDEAAKAIDKAADAAAGAILSFADLASHKFDLDEGVTLNAQHIVKFYEDTLETTRTWSQEIRTLIAQGYDPGLVQRLMEAGPEQAGPVVHALVEGYSADLVGLVNQSEAEIRDISARTAAFARLTQQAMMADTDELARALPRAQEIMAAAWDGMELESIAKKLGMKPEDVQKIADDFGITIRGVKQQADDADVKVDLEVGTAEFDRALADAEIALDYLATGHYDPRMGIKLDELLEDTEFADALLRELTRKRDALVEAEASPSAISRANLAIDALKRRRKATVDVTADTTSARNEIVGLLNWIQGVSAISPTLGSLTGWMTGLRAKGGIDSYAAGGIAPGTRPLIKWAEPETGGEAYIPRLGISAQRAHGLLDTAAGWHGMQVVPKGPLGGGGNVVVNLGGITVDASNAGSPREVGAAVSAAMDRWVRDNPRAIVAAVGGHQARQGRTG